MSEVEMRLVANARATAAAAIETEFERWGVAIRKANAYRIKPNLRRRDSRDRVRPRPAA
jgi:hypothetical protein